MEGPVNNKLVALEDEIVLESTMNKKVTDTTINEKDWIRTDYVMVFSMEKMEHMERIKELLQNAELMVKEQPSRNGDQIFLLISASMKVLEATAERIKLKKKVKEEYGGGWDEFVVAKKWMFELDNGNEEPAGFTTYERAMLIYRKIINRKKHGGAKIAITKEIADGNMLQCFPLHDRDKLKFLVEHWIKRKSWRQPLDLIKEYFGEYIALYFAFLGHYSKWLILPAIVGFIMFIVGLAIGFDNPASPFYCIFIAFWATFYLEFWKRKNAELAVQWDVEDYEDQEIVRPNFHGHLRYGVYSEGEFVSLEPEDGFTPPRTQWAPYRPRVLKFTFGLSILITFLGVVCIATFGVFWFRIIVTRVNSLFGGIAAGVVNAVAILVFNTVYRKIALWLTEWENYRTQSEFEDQFVLKNFLFQFVNSYISLFYIAFMKGRVGLFGKEIEECVPDCMSELTVQLGTIFVTNMLIGQATEVGIPWLTTKLCLVYEERQLKKEFKEVKEATQPEVEAKMTAFIDTFDEYNELAIQFGYLTLFAAAFPLAPLLALINNVIGLCNAQSAMLTCYPELRTDATKLLSALQRPQPRGACDIGSWYTIFSAIGYLACVSNSALIAFTSTELDIMFPGITLADKLWIAVCTEHIVFVIKWMIAKAIPDKPRWVRVLHARQKFFKENAEEFRILRNSKGHHIAVSTDQNENTPLISV